MSALALDRDGRLHIGDHRAAVVRRVDEFGIIRTVAGTGVPGRGGEATPADRTPLLGGGGLTFDAQNRLVLAETDAHRVRRVDGDGLIRTIAGTGAPGHDGDGGLAGAAQLTLPTCLALTPSGALRICDNGRIRQLIPPVPGRWTLPVLDMLSSFAPPVLRPGAWVSLLGDFPGVPTLDWRTAIDSGVALPTRLGEVAVEVDGQYCVLSYVSADHIDVLLPRAFSLPASLKIYQPSGTTSRAFSGSGAADYLTTAVNGQLHVAAFTEDLTPIGPNRPARPGETLKFYVTGLNLGAAYVPPNFPHIDAIQVVIASRGYPVTLPRPFSLGVDELTLQLPLDLPPGTLPIRLVTTNFLSRTPAVLTLARP